MIILAFVGDAELGIRDGVNEAVFETGLVLGLILGLLVGLNLHTLYFGNQLQSLQRTIAQDMKMI